MYAIVKVGGKQYRVEKGDSLLVDRMPDDEGAKVRLEPLLLAPDGGSRDPVFGKDALAKGKVEATVAGHVRGPKIHVLKFKPKRGYKRRQGHRSELTRLEIGDIEVLGGKGASAKKAKPAGSAGGGSKSKAKPADSKAEKTAPDPKKDQGDKLDEAVTTKASQTTKASATTKASPAEKPAATKASPSTKKPAAKKPSASEKPASEEPSAPKEDSDGS